MSYSELLSKSGTISFQQYVSEGISRPVFYGDLVYKLRRVGCRANFVSSGSKIIKHLRPRKYDTVIIARKICFVLDPSTTMFRSFLKHCTLTNKAVGTLWRDLSNPPQRRQGPDPGPLWFFFSRLLQSFDLSSLPHGRSIAYSGGFLYIFLRYCFLSPYMFKFLWPYRCGWSVVFIKRIINIYNMCHFDYTASAVSGKVGIP